MSDSYTKLFSSITESTVWSEPAGTRLVWITMLALVRRDGVVYASLPGLADRAKVSLEETLIALKALSSPDPFSRTKDHEGRRIEEIDGGWLLLNHAKYASMRSTEERREYMRKLMADKRLAEKLARVSKVSPTSTITNTISEKEQKPKKEHARKRASLSPMPIDFDLGVSERVKSWAAENGYTRLDEHLANFVTQAQARAYVYSDWDAALMTAIRKDWAQLGARAQTVKPKSRSAQALETIERLKRGNRSSDPDAVPTPDVPRLGGPAGSRCD